MPSSGTGKGKGKKGFYIPTIDIRPFLEDPSSAAAGEVVEMVRDACVGTGFFQITGHGIPTTLQEAVFAGSLAFFALDIEEKVKLDKSASVGASNRGYEVIGNQGLQEGTLPDLKEIQAFISVKLYIHTEREMRERLILYFILDPNSNLPPLQTQGFYIGADLPASDPRVLANAFLMGPNLWPPPALLPPTTFHDPMTAYYTAMFALSLRILDIVALTLTLPTPHENGFGTVEGIGKIHAQEVRDWFQDFTSNDAVASIRLLHYPPAPNPNPNPNTS
ncbi:2-oxoglutarate-dependent dioxygenase, partial [Lachnellula willkommii]